MKNIIKSIELNFLLCYYNNEENVVSVGGVEMEKFTYFIQFIVDLINLVKRYFGGNDDTPAAD